MNTSLIIASQGLQAYQGKINSISNNMANVDTIGYKERDASFSDNLASSIQNQPDQKAEVGRLTPLGIRTTYGSRIALTALDTSQGQPKETGNPYDLMIEGDGYFQVQRGSGNTKQIMYTRSGAFQISPVGANTFQLVNANGDILLDRNGNPVMGNTSNFQVKPDGTIVGSTQQIGIVQIPNPQLLIGQGGVFQLSGNATVLPGNNTAALKQGFLENSNVDINQEMTDLIQMQRGYQANARALSYADQMMGIANSIYRG